MKTTTISRLICTVVCIVTTLTVYPWSGGISSLKIQNVWYHDPSVDLLIDDTYGGSKVIVSEPQQDDAPYSGELTIIDSYTFPGNTSSYSIKIIKRSAFANSPGLTSITVGKNINSIDELAFANCTNLKIVRLMSETPPATLASNAFEGTDIRKCNLIVPKNSTEIYRSTDIWNRFGSINGTILNGIETISDTDLKPEISTDNRTVTINNISDTDNISVYNTGGTLVDNVIIPDGATSVSFDVTKGLYIIRVNSKGFKIII